MNTATPLYTISFTRNHTTGTLAGMTTEGALTFASETDGAKWLRGVARYHARNGYTVTDVRWSRTTRGAYFAQFA
jgi:hypothetical protein